MKEYKFVNLGEDDAHGHERDDDDFTILLNNYVKLGWEIVSHSCERYWGLTVVLCREAKP